MICKACGEPLPENARTCLKCGAVQNAAPYRTDAPFPPAPRTAEDRLAPRTAEDRLAPRTAEDRPAPTAEDRTQEQKKKRLLIVPIVILSVLLLAGIGLLVHRALTGVWLPWQTAVREDGSEAAGKQNIPSQDADEADGKTDPEPQDLSPVYALDPGIQSILENALTGAMEDMHAKSVIGVVMSTKTGAVLAIADLSANGMNSPGAARQPYKAVTEFYAPGPAFMPFMVAGALEEGVIDENTSYNCSGTITVSNRTIKDLDPGGHGEETPRTLLVNSCNTFAVNVGLKMGGELYYKYYKAFGFTEPTGVDLAGENAPRANDPANWIYGQYHDPAISFSLSDLSSASFGYAVAVTPLQLVTAVSAIGNGGKLMQPYTVSDPQDATGGAFRRQAISEATAATLASWLEDAVTDGTGKNAYVAGYRVAGKTGTADKLSEPDTRMTTFAGFAPCGDPEISVIIVIEGPRGGNGSCDDVAAPVAGEVFEKTLKYLGIQPDASDGSTVPLALLPDVTGKTVSEAQSALAGFKVRAVGSGSTVTSQSPNAGSLIPAAGTVVLYTEANAERVIAVAPDFTGLTVLQAYQLAAANGFNLRPIGPADSTSIACKQDIAPGDEAEAGAVITVQFRADNGAND